MDTYTPIKESTSIEFSKNPLYKNDADLDGIENTIKEIEKNKNNLSALGWQNLLILDFKKYSPICNWAILKNGNYKILKKSIPDIENYRLV